MFVSSEVVLSFAFQTVKEQTYISYCTFTQISSGINLKCHDIGLPECPRSLFLRFASGDCWYFQKWCMFPSMTSDKTKIKNVKTSNEQIHVKKEPDKYFCYIAVKLVDTGRR